MAKSVKIHHIDDFMAGGSQHFYVNTVRNHIKYHHFIEHPHKHDFYLCVLFTKGSGIHYIDFKAHKIKPGTMFFLHPGQMHHWTLSADIDGYIFFHSRDFYDLHYQDRTIVSFPFFNPSHLPVVNINQVTLPKFNWLFEELLDENKMAGDQQYARRCSLIDLVYVGATRLYGQGQKSDTSNSGYLLKLRQLQNMINTHYKDIKSPSEYASAMNMTGKHLNRICMACLNKTLSQLIAERIILEAKRLLVMGKSNVAEVADALGYNDHAYFNRFFKKHTGKTPLEFLRSTYE